ncbi:MAG: glycosyltransferase [Candidatus Omnitrophica bacterium]|nr:glycosyltransferase [Candidatus Omnitrophota bacterium]
MKSLDEYRGIVSDDILAKIYNKATKLNNKHVVNISSTYQGGGVAEILHNLVCLMNDAGLDFGWRILPGTQGFFTTTKRMHNALQGENVNMELIHKDYYLETNEKFAVFTHISHNAVIIHDPQPLPLIKFMDKKQPWIWRCHIDLSNPNKELWDYIKTFILRYDVVIVSDEQYKRKDLPVEQRIIMPSIDPLSTKNMDITDEMIKSYVELYKIPTDKPIVLQISRFDKWKDPEGVIEVFRRVKKEYDCRLILCGSAATDDPEGVEIYHHLVSNNSDLLESGEMMLITAEDNYMVNSLQRLAAVVLQKSTREGFGLTITEALWKGKPVVASNIGGIPNQIQNNKTGILVNPHDFDECAEAVLRVLKDKKFADKIGKAAKEYVREKFLITRHALDYLNLLIDIL